MKDFRRVAGLLLAAGLGIGCGDTTSGVAQPPSSPVGTCRYEAYWRGIEIRGGGQNGLPQQIAELTANEVHCRVVGRQGLIFHGIKIRPRRVGLKRPGLLNNADKGQASTRPYRPCLLHRVFEEKLALLAVDEGVFDRRFHKGQPVVPARN